jgi:hypothetical protein
LLGSYLKSLLDVPNPNGLDLAHRIKIGIKYYPAWKRSLKGDTNALSDQVPWITYEARDFIESILPANAVIFEYGSGGSTLFYSKRAKKVISVEHDANWAGLVQRALIQAAVKNCECRLIPPMKTAELHGGPDDPEAYCSSAEEYRDHSFREYVLSINFFADQFFDFVAVDGRARPSCIFHARRKVKIGGCLMLDNSERLDYQRSKELLSSWGKHEFFGPGPYNDYFWQTTIWKRIHE